GFHVVTLDVGGELVARSVILALGVQYRRLPVPRAADYEGLGIAYAADLAREQLRPDDSGVVGRGANPARQGGPSLAAGGAAGASRRSGRGNRTLHGPLPPRPHRG